METEERNGIIDYNVPPPQPVGIYGWRKRCLYAFLLSLMVVVVINLALTVWILRVLDFSLDGMGRLKITPKGFRLQGEAEFLKPVYVDRLKSEEGKDLYIQSSKAVKLLAVDHNKRITSKVVIGQNNITAKCDEFVVEDSRGNRNLLISKNKVTLGTGDVSFPGEITLDGSIRTPNIISPEKKPLEIRSDTSKIQISGTAGVSVNAQAGNTTIRATDNIMIVSTAGSIQINSPNILLQGLPRADPSLLSYSAMPSTSSSSSLPVYQLCVCENGRVFLGLPMGDCRSSSQLCSSSHP
ncbi:unnamed protein product [Candidula unifasciata]|uniref:Zeta-sarcoglycan n=1 Tax=Candidula unifasciata TaxID=100452 RepID=A0A8S3YP92_9EUPU|nr:unnamed protein product [Candidula unifasciata]